MKNVFAIACALLVGACSSVSQPLDELRLSGDFYPQDTAGSVLVLSRHDNLALLRHTREEQTALAWSREGDSGVRVFTSEAYAHYRIVRTEKSIALVRDGGSLWIEGLTEKYSTEKPNQAPVPPAAHL